MKQKGATLDATARRAAVDSGREPVALSRLWVGVALAPAVWVVGGLAGYYLAARSCEPAHGVPLMGTSHPTLVHILFELAMAVLATIGLVTSLNALRTTRHAERPGDSPAMGRAHFMALAGSIAGALFLFGIVLTGFAGFVVDACRMAR